MDRPTSRGLGRHRPERMPGTGTVVLFRSGPMADHPEGGGRSHLLVTGLQREPLELIEAEPLAELRKVAWDAHATSWSF